MEVDEKYGSNSKSAAGTSPQRLPRFRLNDASREGSNPAPTPSPSNAGGIASSSYQSEQLTSPRGSTIVSQPPLEGSVLGKRRASLMEEPKFLSYQDARPATSLSGHSWLGAKAQAAEAAVSTVFRRESMISPVDLAPIQNRFNLPPSCSQRLPSSLGLQSSYMPSPDAQGRSGVTSPTHRETQAQSLSISVQKVQDVDVGGMEVDHSEVEEHRPSLPGFKSLFGLVDSAEERPIVSRNSSSGFPDLQTLKAPLSLALAPYSGTRSSNDSGTTSIWSSSRSSLGTRESISTTTTSGSVGLTPSSVTSYSSFPFKPQSPGSAGSVRPRQRYQSDSGSHRIGSGSNRGSISQVGIDQDMLGSNVERTGSLLLDLAKRPSYASFNAEVEKQRTEIQRQRSMAEAEEARRRQSDNAAVMSEERKRLLGNSPQPLPQRGFGESVEAPLHLASQTSVNETDTHPDEAIRAARTRLLRYESYPFGSKDAQNGVLGAINPANGTDIHRRQSMFPHRANNEIGPSDMSNLSDRSEPVHIVPNSNFSVNPGWQEPYEQQHPPSTSSQRDIQFEEIVRKASVDLAKRSTTSSLTGTPILGARALVLPILTMESANRASPIPTILHTRIFDGAEVANSREREQHQQSTVHTSAPTSAAASRSATPRRVSSPLHSRDGAFASSVSGHAPHQETLSPSRHGVQESQSQWGDTDEYRRSSFQVPSETSRPALLERSQPQRHSIPMDIDQRQINLPRRSSPPKDLGPSSGSYARPSTRLDKPYNSPIPWHTAYGAPDIDVTRSGEASRSRRESLSRSAAGKHNTVVPYYDNPEPPPVYGANNTLEFPSVLRNDYPLESNNHPPKVGGPSNIMVHDSATHVRPGPNQLALQQQGTPAPAHSLYNTRNPDSRRDSYTSLPPGPARTMTAPNVGSSTTLPGPRYTCDHCGKSFSRPSSLKIHIYSHTGEKPYKCTWPDCTRSFSVQSNLKRHAKVHLENGGQQSIASGNDHPNTELGSGHAATGFPGGSHGTNTPGGPSSGYSTGFLTPQTVQPLPPNHKPEGYFDVQNIHAGPPASHSAAPGGLPKSHLGPAHPPSTAMQGYLASPSNAGNAGPRIPSLLHYSTQGSLTRRESGSGAYGDCSDPR